ncbi:flagellar export chaperone FliS [Marinobacterium jannaschii]|uniref:flagellar export chaperone FliS n=1 Tax=Marinobacterium jannaschii TaxID=64970 RepID=UPI00047F11FB|nr:flagellar export chaperone FliS [Marinobacterium jannaschii]
MSVNLNALKQYQNVNLRAAVESASPHQLILMLFNGALEALVKAKSSIERKDIETRTQQLNKANDIVLALQDYLDHEQGGEIAENLNALYDYIARGIATANRENNPEKIQELMNLILEVKQGWEQMPMEHRQ